MCYKLIVFIAFFFLSTDGIGQYCTSGGPTANADSNVESVILSGVAGNINHLGCPSQLGVEVYMNESVTLSASSSYSLQVDYGTCGGNFASAGSVWIDYDQSNSFTQNEIVGTWTGTPPAVPVVYNVLVPANAHNGITRMRVIQQEGGVLPLNPCASFQWGSVMDFGIVIINGLDCGNNPGDLLTAPIEIPSLPYNHSGDLAFCYGNQNLVYDSPDVFYKLNLNPTMQSINVSTCGSNFDTFLSIVDPNGQVINYNDDSPQCAPQSELSFEVNDLGFVYIIVEGWGTQSGLYQLDVTANYLSVPVLENKEINVYPNPVQNILNFNAALENLEIVDASGKKLIFDKLNPMQIDVHFIAPGYYILHGIIGGETVALPFYKL